LALGRRAEDEAARWYRWRGYRIVDRNWRCAEGEIDLVAVRRRAGLVVFVEVKARTTERFGTAADAVGEDKQQRLRALALRYLEDATVPPRVIRFDVAAWDGGHLSVIEAAF
jgi:putative endonuclease